MVTSRDDPVVNGVYKLVEIDEGGRSVPKVKLSQDKATYPFAKQIFRVQDEAGLFERDVIALEAEDLPGRPLLEPVMRGGELCLDLPTTEAIRNHCLDQVASLPKAVRDTRGEGRYPVQKSAALESALQEVIQRRAQGGE